MKKFIAVCLFCATFNIYAMTFQHAQQVYQKLIRANGLLFAPGLKLSNSSEVNAECGFFTIKINAGMLRFVRNDAELALVLGHELGHYKLGHSHSTPANEFAADARGAYYMSKAGYNVCKGAKAMKRFNDRASDTHPDSNDRYHRLCH